MNLFKFHFVNILETSLACVKFFSLKTLFPSHCAYQNPRMTRTKRKRAGISLVKRWDNHRWFPSDCVNTLLSRGVNSWSPALTKFSQNISNPRLIGERPGGVASTGETQPLLGREAVACSWSGERQCRAPAPVETPGQLLLLWHLAPTRVVPIKLPLCLCNLSCPLPSWVGWGGERCHPSHVVAGQGASTCSYRSWMLKADASWEI